MSSNLRGIFLDNISVDQTTQSKVCVLRAAQARDSLLSLTHAFLTRRFDIIHKPLGAHATSDLVKSPTQRRVHVLSAAQALAKSMERPPVSCMHVEVMKAESQSL